LPRPARVQVFDEYLAQLGEDTAAYCRTVCQTIVLTVPKAVVHCQARRRPAVVAGSACGPGMLPWPCAGAWSMTAVCTGSKNT
jgi:hypothetical protein